MRRVATLSVLLLARPPTLAACSAQSIPRSAQSAPRLHSAQSSIDAGPDARIRYYQQRLGGPSTYPAYARLGLAYAEKARASGRVDYNLDAARYLERSLSMQRNYEALLGLSGVSLALHRFPEALAYAREAVATMSGDPAAQGALFDALLALGDHRAAEEVLESMSAKASFGYLVRRAALREYRGETAEALRSVEQACEQSATEPVLTRAWCQVRLGALHLAICEPEIARSCYQRAEQIIPGYLLAAEHLAELDAGVGNNSQAIHFYEGQVAAISEPRYQMALADLYDTAHKPDRAVEQRQNARTELRRRAADDVRDAWHELALLDAVAVDTAAEAVQWAEKDWQNRKDVHAADTLAWAWSQQGDAAKAEAALEQALAPGGASPALLLHAAVIRARGGRADDARRLLDRARACPAALTPGDHRLVRQVENEVGAGAHRMAATCSPGGATTPGPPSPAQWGLLRLHRAG